MASPSVVFIRSARIRVIASDGPPAENGTTMVMGCDGKLSASALPPNDISAIDAARIVLRIMSSPKHSHGRHCEEHLRRSNPYFRCRAMDCFADPVIGRAFARPVGSQ